MPIIPMINPESLSDDQKLRYEKEVAQHGRATNLKRTLLHSTASFDAFAQWHVLAEQAKSFIGERALMLFSFAISEGNRCVVCGTFFRKILTDMGTNPDAPALSGEESLLFDYGYSIAEDPHNINPAIHAQLQTRYSHEQQVLLLAYAGMMIAFNTFNTVAQVELDEMLKGYERTIPWN